MYNNFRVQYLRFDFLKIIFDNVSVISPSIYHENTRMV